MRRTRLPRPAAALGFAALSCSLATCGGGGGGGGFGAALVHIVTTLVPTAETGQDDYAFTFTATFPHPPGTFAVSGGALPTGMALDVDTGLLHGVPRQEGPFNVEIAARDGFDPALTAAGSPAAAEDRKRFTIRAVKGPLRLFPHPMPTAWYGAIFLQYLDAAGGSPPYTYAETSVAPAGLPAGFALTADGLVGGTPQSPLSIGARYPFQATVTDAAGQSAVQAYEVVVDCKSLIVYTSGALPPASAGFPYGTQLELASRGGGAPFTWTQVPPAPGETLLNDVDMEVTQDGVVRHAAYAPGPRVVPPPPLPSPGPYTIAFRVSVVDAAGRTSAPRPLTLTVRPGPILTSITPNRASKGGPFTVRGLDFQPGCKLAFRPGPLQTIVTPTFVDSTTLTVAAIPPPGGGGGAAALEVVNPDGAAFTLAGAITFPAAGVAFGAKGFIQSPVSSTGLACADLDGDGRADVVHCGAAGLSTFGGTPGGPVSTWGGLYVHMNGGGSPPQFAARLLEDGDFFDVKVSDVNVDGRPDIVALGRTAIHVWLNGVNGDPLGTFSAGPVSPLGPGFGAGMWPSEMSMGLLDADKIPDLVFGVPHYPAASVNGRVYSMGGDGAGGFRPLDQAVTTLTGSYGVLSLACVDPDGDGRSEVAAGLGVSGIGTAGGLGPTLYVASVRDDGTFSAWSPRGDVSSPFPPYLGSVNAVITGDFLGQGAESVLTVETGTPFFLPTTVPALDVVTIFSGPTLSPQAITAASLLPPFTLPWWVPNTLIRNTASKSATALDANFDAKTDWAVSLQQGYVLCFTGPTLPQAATLDASAGSPTVLSPLTGRLARGDLDGDGKEDLLATTSFWQVNAMAAAYGSAAYSLSACGDGGSMGVVFWLNASQ